MLILLLFLILAVSLLLLFVSIMPVRAVFLNQTLVFALYILFTLYEQFLSTPVFSLPITHLLSLSILISLVSPSCCMQVWRRCRQHR